MARMRDGLRAFIAHHGIDPAKYHETMTRAWILAVRHFMELSPEAESAEDFIDRNPRLLDGKIMLTHYSAGLLFSPEARARFVEPDLDAIPRHERPRGLTRSGWSRGSSSALAVLVTAVLAFKAWRFASGAARAPGRVRRVVREESETMSYGADHPAQTARVLPAARRVHGRVAARVSPSRPGWPIPSAPHVRDRRAT